MLPASQDIWQGHPASQAWKLDHNKPEEVTALHHAAWIGNVAAAQALLNDGAPLNRADRDGATALHYIIQGSAQPEQQRQLILLLASNRADLEAKTQKGETALHAAAAQGNVSAITALMQQGADLLHANDTGETPLHLAVRGKHPEAVKLLCQTAAACNTPDEWGLTPLHVAAKAADVDIVRALLLGQADLTLQSWDMRTPLHVAAQHRQPAVIRELLLDPHVRLQLHQSSTPALHGLSHHTHTHAQTSNIAHDPSAAQAHAQSEAPHAGMGDEEKHTTAGQTRQQDQTAHPLVVHPDQDDMLTSQDEEEDSQMQAAADSLSFLQSASLGSASSLDQPTAQGISNPAILTSQSASLGSASSLDQATAPSEQGISNPAIMTSHSGVSNGAILTSHSGEDMQQADADSSLADADALDALLSLTADCSMQSPRQAKPASGSVMQQQQHLLQLRDHQGNTALHLAAMEGLPESVQLLLQAGAPVNVPGLQQRTPLSLAMQFGHIQVAQMMNAAGAV